MDKSINKTKYLRKKKYSGNKPKETKDAAIRASKLARSTMRDKLGSNYDRYDENPEDVPEEQKAASSRNFAAIATMPITEANYFQFKKDKGIFLGDDNGSQINDLFNLDLQLLSCSLSSVPFHQFLGVPEDTFLPEEIRSFNKSAAYHTERYKGLVENKMVNDEKIEKPATLVTRNSENDEKCVTEPTVEDILPVQHLTVAEVKAKSDIDELEDWLDDILDD